MSTPTPRTDAERELIFTRIRTEKAFDWIDGIEAFADFARNLETELTAALTRVGELEKEAKASRTDAFLASKSIARLNQEIESLTRQLSEPQAQLASAREDGARLDWLDAQGGDISETETDENEWKVSFVYPIISGDGGEDLRSAIDAARGHLSETPAGGETGKESIQAILANARRLYLHYRNANADFSRVQLDIGRIIKSLERISTPLPPPPQEKETRE